MGRFKLFLIFILSIESVFAQGGVEKICVDYTLYPPNSYFSDIEHTFDPFIGEWKWTNGSQILIIELLKVSHHYSVVSEVYKDVMVGNYRFSTDGGATFTIDTFSTPFSQTGQLPYPLFGLCVEDAKINFSFYDVGYQKSRCNAIFENLGTTPPTLRLTLQNPKELVGVLDGQPPIPAGFSIPSDVILTKQ
jgi:hypothetical protein